jgi:hypothetical protein
MVGSTIKGPKFAQFALLSRGVVLRQLWTQHGLMCLGVKCLNFLWALHRPFIKPCGIPPIDGLGLTPKGRRVYFVKIASKHPLLKAR